MFILAMILSAFSSETYQDKTFYFGDLHAHTGVSPDGWASDVDTDHDGLFDDCVGRTPVCGALADVFVTAKANGLDFVALTDHNNSDSTAYNALLARVLTETTSTFVTIPAVELSFRSTSRYYGHKNMLIFQDDNTKLAGLSLSQMGVTPRVKTDCAIDIWTNATVMNSTFGPTLMFAHHPDAQAVQTTDWSCHNQTYEPVVEIYGGWGNALTLNAADYDQPDLNTDALSNDSLTSAATIHEALQTFGLKVGFVGGTDLHDTRPGQTCDRALPKNDSGHIYGGGLTMVVLDKNAAFKRSSIYNEMVARRTLVTTGPRMPVLVQWTTDSLHSIGEELSISSTGTTSVKVSIPSGWEALATSVRVVGYSTSSALLETSGGIWEASFQNSTLPAWLYVEVAIDGNTLYGTSCNDGGIDQQEFVWSSPVWFSTAPAPVDADHDGYAVPIDCNDLDAKINPAATEIYRDGIDQNCDGKDTRR